MDSRDLAVFIHYTIVPLDDDRRLPAEAFHSRPGHGDSQFCGKIEGEVLVDFEAVEVWLRWWLEYVSGRRSATRDPPSATVGEERRLGLRTSQAELALLCCQASSSVTLDEVA